MPNYCCIVGCRDNSYKPLTLCFSCVPKVLTRGEIETEEITKRRRAAWIKVIKGFDRPEPLLKKTTKKKIKWIKKPAFNIFFLLCTIHTHIYIYIYIFFFFFFSFQENQLIHTIALTRARPHHRLWWREDTEIIYGSIILITRIFFS